jgi:hypothetical protein
MIEKLNAFLDKKYASGLFLAGTIIMGIAGYFYLIFLSNELTLLFQIEPAVNNLKYIAMIFIGYLWVVACIISFSSFIFSLKKMKFKKKEGLIYWLTQGILFGLIVGSIIYGFEWLLLMYILSLLTVTIGYSVNKSIGGQIGWLIIWLGIGLTDELITKMILSLFFGGIGGLILGLIIGWMNEINHNLPKVEKVQA